MWIKHAAEAMTVTITIIVTAIVVSTMWQSMILWMTTSVVHTTTTMNMLIPEAIDWEIVEH
jgi:hypothetical protein